MPNISLRYIHAAKVLSILALAVFITTGHSAGAADDDCAKIVMPVRGICAHRGASETHPENTLAAFREAIRLGAHQIEMDVSLTKDGHLVIMHDATVDRTTNGKGAVRELTLAQIKKLDAGSKKHARFAGEQVPTLRESLEIMPLNIWLNLHLRNPAEVGELTAREVIRQNRRHQAFLACSRAATEAARRVDPSILICNMERQSGDADKYIDDTIARKCQFIQLYPKLPSSAQSHKLKDAGVRINLFQGTTVKSLADTYKAGVQFPLVDNVAQIIEQAKSFGVKPLVPIYRNTSSESDAATKAKEILKLTGIQGGIIVHLGCGDGALTAALRANERYTVQGLDTDANNVHQARKRLASMGIQGPVSIERHVGRALPYVDNLINLIVVEEPGDVQMSEVMRVLAPEGVACVRRNNSWHVKVKPRPQNIDQWTHYLYDATNNAVARDDVVGPPRSLKWLAPPQWLRSHETPSGIQSPVASGQRLFYIFDRGLIGIIDERLPDRWSLVCRDAFNGKCLWERPLDSWGWREWSRNRLEGKDWTVLSGLRTNVPAENQRRLVADGDRLYATLSYRSPMSILDAATGRTLNTIDATRGTREILARDGIALVYAESTDASAAKRRGTEKSASAALFAIDGVSAKVCWRHACAPIHPMSLAIDQGRVLYLAGGKLHGLRWKDGREQWKTQTIVKRPKAFVAIDGVVVMHNNKNVVAHDASDGKLLWKKQVAPLAGAEAEDLFVIDGLVWRGMECIDDELKHIQHSPNVLLAGWDLRTGDEKRRIVVKNFRSPEHHHRCYRNKATDRYVISSFEGAEFVDLKGDHHRASNWLRGSCKSGMMPCNGMLYVPPDQCFCQPGAKLLGYAAVTPADGPQIKPLTDDKRLEKGPAYKSVTTDRKLTDADWPTF
ncbi:MAG: PQQ-binding-like beta-propeller repeat protein, partial [Pirellulales bacterium]|nr:PQQ-binding-like beta-propeller repeat protein [Pirellulales bacterium]